MKDGWIKLHRKLFDKAIWKCSPVEHKVVLITLLLMASHKDNQWIWRGKKFVCKPGQFVTSLQKIAELAECSVKNVRTSLINFEKLEFLANESTKTGRLITIINWDTYQVDDKETGKDTGKDPAKTRQTGGNYQECKEGKKVRKEKGPLTGTRPILCPHQKIIDLYHQILPSLPHIQVWDETSKKNLRTRWKEDPQRQCLEFWTEFFKYISASNFLMGRVKDWSADLSWIIRPTNFAKIINGVYHKNINQKTNREIKIFTTMEAWLDAKRRKGE